MLDVVPMMLRARVVVGRLGRLRLEGGWSGCWSWYVREGVGGCQGRSNLGGCVCVGAGAFALAVSYRAALRNPRVSKTAVSKTRAVSTTRK